MTQAKRLRAQIENEGMIIAPGAYDCITAKAIENAGFSAVYMSGGSTAMSMGFPDFGLVTMTEMAENAGRISAAVNIPVIADADTGFGNELNVVRTMRTYEERGVAAIQIEDQVFPKRCGHLDGKEVISVDDFVAKIRAAAAAKRNPDTVIVARTDARSVNGLADAVHRMNCALKCGADIAFLEAPQDLNEINRVPKLVNGPCMLNMVRGGMSPSVDVQEVRAAGYGVAIMPGLLFRHIIASCDDVLRDLMETDSYPASALDLGQKKTFERFGAGEWDDLRVRFR